MSIRVSVVIAAVAAAGCGDDGGAPFDAPVVTLIDAPADPRVLVVELSATVNRNVDLLFVLDDSPSMADKQDQLAANFPSFINVLTTFPDGLPDIHVGVVTTDVGTKGAIDVTPGPAIGQIGNGGCSGTGDGGNLQTFGAMVTGTYISDLRQTNGTRTRNYNGDLATVFGAMARGAGAGGCGFEQPLAAMRRALDNNPQNAGFLRPAALLGVVFVTDEDDCTFKTSAMLGPESAALGPLHSFRCTRFGVTCAAAGTTSDEMNQVGLKTGCTGSVDSGYMTDVAPYAAFLRQLKADPRLVVVGSITGPPMPVAVELRPPPGSTTASSSLAPACSYAGAQGLETADPAVRLHALLDQFPEATSRSSVCEQNVADGLVDIARLVLRRLGMPCLGVTLADAAPEQPGVQVDCSVEDVVGSTVTPIPACANNPTAPCWTLQADVAMCGFGDHLKLVVTRSQPPAPTTVTQMRCLLP